MAVRASTRNGEENVPKGKDGQVAGVAGETRRRALGDIGNVQGVLTRAQAAALKAGGKPQTSLRPRDPNATAAALSSRSKPPSSKPTAVSLSSLLQSRSDAASVPKAARPAASPLPDIDSNDRLDPLAASDYVHNIYSYYRRVEPKFRVDPGYMSTQVEINDKMRSILVDWLVEVHLKFKLMPETLYLTCHLIDRFLALKNVTRKRLQLVGVTAMLIASKYEEIWAPEVRDFVYISDKAYSRDEILAMEKTMLCTLKFELTMPTIFNFTARFRKAAGVEKDTAVAQQVEYVSELSVLDINMLRFPPSLTAAAAVHVALVSADKEDTYPQVLARHSGYSLTEVLPAAHALVALMRKAPTASLNAVHKKFCSSKYGEVAKWPVPELEARDESL